MISLRLKFSHRHIFPAIFLWLLVVSFVDLGMVFKMSRLFAIIVYSGQIIGAIVAFYAVLLVNFLDLTRTYIGYIRNPAWFIRMLSSVAFLLTYFVFFCRISLLSFFEVGSVAILIGTWLLNVHIDNSSAIYWLLPLFIISAFIHIWVERNNLGEKAVRRN